MSHFSIHIQKVATSPDMERFLAVPRKIYKNDPHWVEPLHHTITGQLATNNSFQTYGEHQPFIAQSHQGELLGRIVVAVNQRLIAKENRPIGLFGYFECINDFEVAKALFDAAVQWLRERSIQAIRGPIDLSTHNNCLLLVDGFDSQPLLMMPYNPSYYPQLLAQYGFEKAKDAYAYQLPLDQPLSHKFERSYKIACRAGINFRPIRLKGDDFEKDCRNLYHLLTEAFADNWSATSRTESEFLAQAKDLQSLGDREIFFIAEDQGRMVGVFMALPDYNRVFKSFKGQLNWLSILKFLGSRRQIDQARVLVICSLAQYRRKMLPLALVYAGMQGNRSKRKPYRSAELSWVWEDNYNSRKLIEATGATIYKIYRMYELSL